MMRTPRRHLARESGFPPHRTWVKALRSRMITRAAAGSRNSRSRRGLCHSGAQALCPACPLSEQKLAATGFGLPREGYVRLDGKLPAARWGAALRESDTVDNARRALGAQLAAYRRAAGHSQARLASRVGYSRSTSANVETGRQRVPRDFWKNADTACRAGGVLMEASDEVETVVRREREDVARQARPSLLALAGSPGIGGSVPLTPASGGALEMPGDGDSGRDAIAIAASEARGHGDQPAGHHGGPPTVAHPPPHAVPLPPAHLP